MKRHIVMVTSIVVFAGAAFAMGDPPQPSADTIAASRTKQLTAEAERQTGMPGITNFTERKAVKWLYELRDEPNYRTYTYIVTMTGNFVKVCDSVGYGINASIQYSNPERLIHNSGPNGRSAATMPQPEPNGLFMPEGLAATYVLCVDAESDDVKAVYVEPEVVVSPFPLKPQ